MSLSVNSVVTCPKENTTVNVNADKDVKRKKVTAAVASVIQPGAGQLINGDYKKAIAHYIISIPLYPGNDMINSTFDKIWRARSAYDAYKNAGTKEQVQEYKEAG